jgi:pimeloyl-ACP methyl ester carboxylesterase
MVPETKYARCGSLHIAYQVVGEGSTDLVFVPGIASHVEFQWEEPTQAAFFRRLSSFSRLIRFDKRGAGLSDPVPSMPTIEERMDDIRAVMDAAGSERAALLGLSEGGPLSLVFAATHPERTLALILWNTQPKFTRDATYPFGFPPEAANQIRDVFEREWGTGAFAPFFVASAAEDEHFRAWWKRFERLALSPGAAIQSMRMNLEIDVRHVLPVIRSPTLVLHNAGDLFATTDSARYMAERIHGAKYKTLDGNDHFAWREEDGVTEEIEEFLTGSRHVPETNRALATVLFTDVVGSTAHAAELGDHRWRLLLDRHDAIVRREIERFRGRLVDSAGDGVFASFDGPARAIRCARQIGEEIRSLGLEIRAGLHTGEVEVREKGLGGIAVHIGARVASLASGGEVLVSSTVKDLVAGSGISFADRGQHKLKGVPGEWHLFCTDR